MADAGARSLLDPPEQGRIHSGATAVTIADVDPSGRCRLDSILRFSQDIARLDLIDSGLDGSSGWLARRILVDVTHWPSLDETLTLATWCSGHGGRWAERRTSLSGDEGAQVEAVAVWVQVDLATGRPSKLSDGFFDVYGDAAQGRKVSARTELAATPPAEAGTIPWPIRLADLDIVGHMNNASQCAAFEEALDFAVESVGPIRAEVEFGASLERSSTPTLAWLPVGGGVDAWLIGDSDTATAARIRSL